MCASINPTVLLTKFYSTQQQLGVHMNSFMPFFDSSFRNRTPLQTKDYLQSLLHIAAPVICQHKSPNAKTQYNKYIVYMPQQLSCTLLLNTRINIQQSLTIIAGNGMYDLLIKRNTKFSVTTESMNRNCQHHVTNILFRIFKKKIT